MSAIDTPAVTPATQDRQGPSREGLEGRERLDGHEPSSVSRVLARNTAWNYIGFAFNLAANFVLFPYVVHRLGDAAAGIWLLLGSVTGYMGLLELGIVPSLTQSIAAASARDERDAVNRAASSAQALLLVLGLVALLALPIAGPVSRTLGIPPELSAQAMTAFQITLLGFVLRMPLATYQGILLGRQRQDRCNQLWIAIAGAKFIGAAVVLSNGGGLIALVATEVTVHLLAGALQIRWVYEELPTLSIALRHVHRADAARLLSFGGTLMLVNICSLLIEQTDRLVIAASLPVREVTYYAAAWKLYMLAYAVTTTLAQAVSPLAADLHGRGNHGELRELVLRMTKFSGALSWPLCLGLAFAGGPFLEAWMGDRFIAALPVVQVLAASFIVTAFNHATWAALVGTRRVSPLVASYFVPQAALNLLLSVWLVHRFGNIGVALGTLVPAVVLQPIYIRFMLKQLELPARVFLTRAVRPVSLPAVLFAPLVAAYAVLGPAAPVLPPIALACAAAYGALVWRGMEAQERAQILAYAPTSVRRWFGPLDLAPEALAAEDIRP